ncbi:hypothetical protein ACFQS3_18835 [Glycomyces mayteni]|uniref:Uncharacterized protein n=1 Tax=Glycomyces mayteni TaxID=543887 RepID=A0ABW2DDG7_9ACTN|nr:hypothetical protein GCM10025732_02440 [Glycomyces mayteni]
MNIEFPEISKRLLAVSGATLIGLAALSACGTGDDAAGGGSEDTGSDTTTAAEEAAEEDTATGDGLSPEAPLPAGSTVEVGDWTLSVSDVQLDATDAIMAENEFNEAPADGNTLAMFTVDGTYNGAETGTLWLDATVGIWADGVMSETCTNVVPNDIINTVDVTAGATSTGATCAEVPADAEQTLIYIEDIWALDGTVYYIEIA